MFNSHRAHMVGAFEQAWSLLKALPEQQMYSQLTEPVGYGFSPSIEQQRLGTVHPAIAGMTERLQSRERTNPFFNVQPDLRVAGPMPQLNTIDSYRGGENHAGYIMQPTQLSTENYRGGGHNSRYPLFFEGERAIDNNTPSLSLGDSGDLDTAHLNIPKATGGTITNNAPLRPRDISY